MILDEAILYNEREEKKEKLSAEFFTLEGEEMSELFICNRDAALQKAEYHRQIAEWLRNLKQIQLSVQEIKAEINDILPVCTEDRGYRLIRKIDVLQIINKHIY